MSGFLPIAHDALAVCCDELDEFAVLDLYRRAHRLRWGALRVTERSLSTKWRMGNRRVWSLLEQLEAVGVAKITKGGRRTPTIIEIYPPVGVQQSDQQSDQQNKPRPTPTSEDRAAQDAAQDAATLSETRERDLRIFRVLAARATYRRAWPSSPASRAITPRKPRAAPRDDGEALWRMIESDEVADRVVSVLEWLTRSDHRDAQTYRTDGRDLVTVWRHLARLSSLAEDMPAGQPSQQQADPWAEVTAAVKGGKLRHLCRERDDIAAAVEAIGGTHRLNTAREDQWQWLGREFSQAYRRSA